ncbi:hypothetical protein NQ315_015173 [Exocentrus adspersus]|uniref:Uncharacterized protein n=1 Tax=Exocentrus adspersus TaxID=1586481 RepID=A0AAV8VC99_9CUCU|nr:hypothetical protein NQ315_015173 [Exocentrus adspersus]
MAIFERKALDSDLLKAKCWLLYVDDTIHSFWPHGCDTMGQFLQISTRTLNKRSGGDPILARKKNLWRLHTYHIYVKGCTVRIGGFLKKRTSIPCSPPLRRRLQSLPVRWIKVKQFREICRA